MNIPAHTPATLTARVYRAPDSLAPYHYHLLPGQAVRIHSTTDQEARCYCGEPGAPRIGEDYFTVPLSSLAFATPAAPDTATEEMLAQPDTLPAFRPGAPVRVKIPAGHEPSAYNGERGHLVCQDGEMWQVIFPTHGLTRAFFPDELTVLE